VTSSRHAADVVFACFASMPGFAIAAHYSKSSRVLKNESMIYIFEHPADHVEALSLLRSDSTIADQELNLF